MRLVIQRVKQSNVKVDGEVIGEIDKGLLVLVGISEYDTEADVEATVNKMINLRIFEDEDKKMNLSLKDISGSVLSVSQFTLYADVKKGRRPNFTKAARPNEAEQLYNHFNKLIIDNDISVQTGQFGAMMDVELTNDGPITIIIETKDGKIV